MKALILALFSVVAASVIGCGIFHALHSIALAVPK
jgi:hypothetical protein